MLETEHQSFVRFEVLTATKVKVAAIRDGALVVGDTNLMMEAGSSSDTSVIFC
jgi:hypothetical protein